MSMQWNKKTHEEVPNLNWSYCSQKKLTFFDQTVTKILNDINDRVKILSNFSIMILPF